MSTVQETTTPVKEVEEAVYTTTLPGLKIVIKPMRQDSIDGVPVSIPGKSIEFVDGFFKTKDPLIQKIIERKRYFGIKVLRLTEAEAQARLNKERRGDGKVTELRPKE